MFEITRSNAPFRRLALACVLGVGLGELEAAAEKDWAVYWGMTNAVLLDSAARAELQVGPGGEFSEEQSFRFCSEFPDHPDKSREDFCCLVPASNALALSP